jgi:hypothetical protein
MVNPKKNQHYPHATSQSALHPLTQYTNMLHKIRILDIEDKGWFTTQWALPGARA